VTKDANYWLTTVNQPEIPVLQLPAKTDTVVIGAGFSGLSAALTLAKAGASTTVLEAETVGWGASSRNGGMVLTGLKLGPEILIKKFGRDRARQLFKFSLDSIETVEKIVADELIDCSFKRTGHLEVAWKPSHFEGYSRAAEMMSSEFGHSVKVIPRSEQHNEIGSDLYFGGMADELSAGINPAQFVMGLARSASKAGATIHERTRVIDVQRHAGGFAVKTNRGTIHAENIFVGTSGYSGRAIPHIQKRIIPIGSYVIATEPLSGDIARQVSPRNRMIFDSKHFLYYFRLTPDNRLLFGGRAAFMPENENSTHDSAQILRNGMLLVFPQLKNVPVEYAWGGTLDFALDSMPHAGSMNGIHHAVGYAGHGVAFATHFGTVVAQQMLGLQVENPFAGLPFRGIPFYNGTPWFLPFAGLYYKILDNIS